MFLRDTSRVDLGALLCWLLLDKLRNGRNAVIGRHDQDILVTSNALIEMIDQALHGQICMHVELLNLTAIRTKDMSNIVGARNADAQYICVSIPSQLLTVYCLYCSIEEHIHAKGANQK